MRRIGQRKPQYQVNNNIRAAQVRVIDADGNNLGVMDRQQALAKAYADELDLVVIAEQANPPVVKIIEFSKFKYEQEKSKSKNKKGKTTSLKQLRFKPNIDDHDLEVRVNRAKGFLKKGDMVKFIVQFMGRTIMRKEIGHQKLDKIWFGLQEVAEIEKDRWMEGNRLMIIVKPK